jgi:hypothetical protein
MIGLLVQGCFRVAPHTGKREGVFPVFLLCEAPARRSSGSAPVSSAPVTQPVAPDSENFPLKCGSMRIQAIEKNSVDKKTAFW